MARLRKEEIVTLKVLIEKGLTNAEIARQLGVTEGTIRYQRRKTTLPPSEGNQKPQKAEEFEEFIHFWMTQHKESKRPANIKELHQHLVFEHGYKGSYNSIRRYIRKHYSAPKLRTYRRVETPPGAQAQLDWGEYPNVHLVDGTEGLHAFVMVLSHSRQWVVIWSRREDQLSWLTCHNEAYRRLGGIAAVNRIDNLKTAIVDGAGAWGTINSTYRSYSKAVGFHIDACAPREANQKGKVEAKVRLSRLLTHSLFDKCGSIEELQQLTDQRIESWSQKAICPVTGESVYDTWQAEREFLKPLPILPEPFDVVVTRPVSRDSLVNFEGRQYNVPFAFVGQRVEVRGCCGIVQILSEGRVLREYPRGTKQKLLLDQTCYEGTSTEHVEPPPPLGKMGRKLQELMEQPVEQRPLDLYAALAEVAR